jgi:xanthine dehydrogenase YagS FAD-binding subunit
MTVQRRGHTPAHLKTPLLFGAAVCCVRVAGALTEQPHILRIVLAGIRRHAQEMRVSVSEIRDLAGISSRAGGGLRIGALAKLAEIAENHQVRESYRVLAEAAAAVGSPQLRNQGTLGGNLYQRPRCSYFRGDFRHLRKGGDTCFTETGENQFHAILGWDRCFIVHPSDTASALTALGARVTIASRKGRRTIPIESFFVPPKVSLAKENVLEPGELLTEVLLDPLPARSRSTYRKVRERGAFDFALAGAAVVMTLSGGKVQTVRIALSGVAPVPWRSVDAEKALAGKPLGAATMSAAAEAAGKDATPIGKNEYMIALVRGVLPALRRREATRALLVYDFRGGETYVRENSYVDATKVDRHPAGHVADRDGLERR